MVNEKIVFLYAFLFAVMVFFVGFLIGFSIENFRNNLVYQTYTKSEINLLDVRVQNDILSLFPIKNCELAISENIKFGDKIYEEAKMLERYESANKLSKSIELEHKKFDLLRTLFWINSIIIKEKCNSSYINVVYFYKNKEKSLEERAKQAVFSKQLYEIKEEFGNTIMLIPIGTDTNLTSVENMMNYYNITKTPSILINEKIKIEDIIEIEKLKEIIKEELNK